MSINRLASVTVGVPEPEVAGAFYRSFGLEQTGPARFATTDGGDQLHLTRSPRRRLVAIDLGCADPDDVARAARSLGAMGLEVARPDDRSLEVEEPATGVRVRVVVEAPVDPAPRTQAPFNAPGSIERLDARAPGILREGPVRPRKLSHVVVGSPEVEASRRFFVEGLGFAVSDEIEGVGAFLRCSAEHHNVLVQAAPVTYLHHTSWQVDDVDEIGRGAAAMLAEDPARHVWGLGRHFIGSNFFWYLRDPAGNFAEYSSDIDVIVDDEVWQPQVWSGMRSLMAWGPPVPASFIAPDDLGELMAG